MIVIQYILHTTYIHGPALDLAQLDTCQWHTQVKLFKVFFIQITHLPMPVRWHLKLWAVTQWGGHAAAYLGQKHPHSTTYKRPADGAVAQGWGARCTTTEMSTREEDNLCFSIHTDLALQTLVFCGFQLLFSFLSCQRNKHRSPHNSHINKLLQVNK